MTTTDHLQLQPDYYISSEPPPKLYISNNPRYKNFTQIHFTAGDEQQFQNHREFSNDKKKLIKTKKTTLPAISSLFHNLEKKYVDSTFYYLFNKFKKGIYVKINNNVLKVFLPFSKSNFTNEWSDNIKYPTGVNEFIKHACKLQGFEITENKINTLISSWYSNNCLLRHEYPTREGDSGLGGVKDMLLELCRLREIPDIEFFINKRDFPLLKNNLTEPYESLYNNRNLPLLSHKYDKYYPILSMTTSDDHADIAIPTLEDWARVSNIEDGKLFVPPRSYKYTFNTDFSNKKSIAVFRGASTGEGTTVQTNMRLKLGHLSSLNPLDEDGSKLLDAGITKWNTRIRKEYGNDFLTTVEYPNFSFGLSSPLTPEEQSQYKYIVNVDGHCSAFRLSLELGMGSVILLVNSRYRLWYHHVLKPWYHYVPVNGDLSDLLEKIKWCKNNEEKCRTISKNALDFYNKNLSKDGILDYMQTLLITIRKKMGYNSKYNKYTLEKIQNRYIFKNIESTENKNINPEDYTLIVDKKTVKIFQNSEKNRILKIADKHISSTKYNENINEIFVGFNCLNNIRQYVPNFPKILGYKFYEDSIYIEKEWIQGLTLDNWIKSKNFKMKDFIEILIQINLALFSAQTLYGFVHLDLLPWNVVIAQHETPVTINYPWINGKMVSYTTCVVPHIIDYGKSSVVYNSIRFGTLTVTTIHDSLSILITSLFEVLKVENSIKDILKIANFIGNSKFCPIIFKNIKKLRIWLADAKKYNNIIYFDKKDLNSKTVIDFVDYITYHFYIKLNFEDRKIPTITLPQNTSLEKLRLLTLENNFEVYQLSKIISNILNSSDVDCNFKQQLLDKIQNIKLTKKLPPVDIFDISDFVDLRYGKIKKITCPIQKLKELKFDREIYFPIPSYTFNLYCYSTYHFYSKAILTLNKK